MKQRFGSRTIFIYKNYLNLRYIHKINIDKCLHLFIFEIPALTCIFFWPIYKNEIHINFLEVQ